MSQRRSERLQIKREADAKRKWEQEKEEASNKIIKAVDEFIRIVNRGVLNPLAQKMQSRKFGILWEREILQR